MKINKKLLITFVFSLLINIMGFSNDNNFTFDIALLKWDVNNYEVLPIKKLIKFNDGDKFQIYIKSDKTVFCYIIYEDVEKNIVPFYHSKLEMNKEYFFPAKDAHFQIEPPNGQEKFYIIISSEKMQKIESMLYSKDTVELLDEIIKLKQSKTSFAQAPERPVPMGGVSRGGEKLEASAFSGDSSYVKTIRFKH